MKYLFSLYLIIYFVGCSAKESIPGDVFPEEKMQAILWDFMRADEMVFYYEERNQLDSMMKTKLYNTIFKIHNVSKEDFKKSVTYYQTRPDLLKVILDSLQKKSEPAIIPMEVQ